MRYEWSGDLLSKTLLHNYQSSKASQGRFKWVLKKKKNIDRLKVIITWNPVRNCRFYLSACSANSMLTLQFCVSHHAVGLSPGYSSSCASTLSPLTPLHPSDKSLSWVKSCVSLSPLSLMAIPLACGVIILLLDTTKMKRLLCVLTHTLNLSVQNELLCFD